MKKTKINMCLGVCLLGFIVSPVFALELTSQNIASLGCNTADKECDLSDKGITTIKTGTFLSYSGLRTLDLSGNAISKIATDIFSGLSDLSFLSLANNQISTIESGAFQSLKSLSKLDISDNKITEMSKAMFSGLQSLTTLYIGGNKFSGVESGFLEALSGVKMLLVKPESEPNKEQSELDIAFEFARKYTLTDAKSLNLFGPEKAITRRALAKILVLYMQNYKKIDAKTIKGCSNFSDIRNETKENQQYIKQACEYKLMGRESDQKTVAKKFNPDKEVTRAHFATIFSRILWGDKYNSTNKNKYYEGHIRALKKIGVLTNTDFKIIEPRGFIILMLSRAK